jgi:hypothetical protein
MGSMVRVLIAALTSVALSACSAPASSAPPGSSVRDGLARDAHTGGVFTASVSFSAPTNPERVEVTLNWNEAVEAVPPPKLKYAGMVVTSVVVLGVAHDKCPPKTDAPYSILGEQVTTGLPTTKVDSRFARCLKQGQTCTYAPKYTVRVMLRGVVDCGSSCTPIYVTKYVTGTVTIPAQAGTECVMLSIAP